MKRKKKPPPPGVKGDGGCNRGSPDGRVKLVRPKLQVLVIRYELPRVHLAARRK